MKQKFENTGPPEVSVRQRWLAELERSPNFQVQAYTFYSDRYRRARSVTRLDRAIVATARYLRCPLITADGVIQDSDPARECHSAPDEAYSLALSVKK